MKKMIGIILGILFFLAIALYFSFDFFSGFFGISDIKSSLNLNIKDLNDKSDLIVVITPVKDSTITSPLSIAGRARGSWFFEGSFPLVLTDWDGKIIAEGHATAQGEWMTNDFVKFVGTLEFTKPSYGKNGFLILKKDNPSGMPTNDNALEIPVVFK
jgi:hypothetical protein